MGFLVPVECASKGCGVLRRGLAEGCELDVGAVLAARSGGRLCAGAACAGVLWTCSPAHKRAAAAAVLADVAATGRRKEGTGRAASLAEQGVALRDLLRLSAARGMPQGELLLRLIARIAPELVPTEAEEAEAAAAAAEGE
jgi:hypothetical protein